ncbi:hypothetical protein IFM89_021046 [Coptis chinensis]|uniref:OB domain-containing protein n=1 Tax=Coptis chinensis TaxID=261450 RepID=A0A835LFZ2_9MAGN|nr:hypothetical protein IFM89_021046 [Coptis chinensis]
MFSQFDGNVAFSGGGFMPSQSLQSTDPGYSSSSKNRDSQVLLPLTVKQIKDASNPNDEKSNIVVDGVDVNNIKLVGMVSDRVERATDVSFSIDDGTGRLVCHRWLNESIDSKEMEEIQDGMYVRVHGALKVFQGKIQLNTFSIRYAIHELIKLFECKYSLGKYSFSSL